MWHFGYGAKQERDGKVWCRCFRVSSSFFLFAYCIMTAVWGFQPGMTSISLLEAASVLFTMEFGSLFVVVF